MTIGIYQEPEKRPSLEELAARTAAEATTATAGCPQCGCKEIRNGRCRHCGKERKQ